MQDYGLGWATGLGYYLDRDEQWKPLELTFSSSNSFITTATLQQIAKTDPFSPYWLA